MIAVKRNIWDDVMNMQPPFQFWRFAASLTGIIITATYYVAYFGPVWTIVGDVALAFFVRFSTSVPPKRLAGAITENMLGRAPATQSMHCRTAIRTCSGNTFCQLRLARATKRTVNVFSSSIRFRWDDTLAVSTQGRRFGSTCSVDA